MTHQLTQAARIAVFGVALAASARAADELPVDRQSGGYALGCQAYVFHRFTTFEAIEKTAAAGGKIIELYPGQFLSKNEPGVRLTQDLSDAEMEKLKAQLKQCDVLAVSFGVVDIPRNEAGARKIFIFAKKMGLRCITAEPAIEQMDTLEKLVREFDIKLAIHNHPKRAGEPDYKVWDPAYVAKMVAGRDPRMGAMADVGHWTRSGIRVVDALKTLEGRIIGCHLKDVVETGNPDAPDEPLGFGVSNVPSILSELRRQRFHGFVLIEYERDWENSLPDIAQCIGYVRGYGDAQMNSTGPTN
jgi:sugar phosphate isomerase/epimerase